MDLCGAERFALVRFAGATSRAHSGPRAELAQEANAGYRPLCTLTVRVALPPTYALGELNPSRARGLALSEVDGPSASRRLAV